MNYGQSVPRGQIVVNDMIKNIRTTMDPDAIETLKASIILNGLLNPPVVLFDASTDTYQLVAGARRLTALDALYREELAIDPTVPPQEVPVTILSTSVSIEDAAFMNVRENIDREDLNICDQCDWLHHMHTVSIVPISVLAENLSRGETFIRDRVRFWELACDKLKDWLRKGGIRFDAAFEIAVKFSKEEQDKRVQRAIRNDEKLTLEQVRAEASGTNPRPGKKAKQEVKDLAAGKVGLYAEGVRDALAYVEGEMTREDLEGHLDARNGEANTDGMESL